MLPPSKRSGIPPFIVMDVMQEATLREAAGNAVFHLEVGQPGTPAPAAVREAAQRALAADNLGYTLALGTDGLRSRIASHYRSFYGAEVDPATVVITNGASGAFLIGFLAAFDPGDRVALARPGYPCYRNILRALGITPVEIETSAESRFQPTPALLDQLAVPVQGLIVASPANPTGTVISDAAMSELAAYCDKHAIRLISDEIYHGITYGDVRAVSALGYSPDALVVNSFSKYFSMTGWRLGWMVVPANLVRSIERLSQNLFICPPVLSQLAATAAFDSYAEMDGHVARYAENRDLLLDALRSAGVSEVAPPDGAFYLYADLAHLTDDSEDLCRRLLADTGVAITPGVDFDPQRGHRTVRLSYCGSSADVRDSVALLGAWFRKERETREKIPRR